MLIIKDTIARGSTSVKSAMGMYSVTSRQESDFPSTYAKKGKWVLVEFVTGSPRVTCFTALGR